MLRSSAIACSLAASKEALCAGADVDVVVTVAAAAGGAATETVGFLSVLSVEAGCRCFSSCANPVTRVSKLCTPSRNCLTSSADAGAGLLACARLDGHHASSARHIPIVYRREVLRIGVLLLCEVWLIIRSCLSRLASTSSNRVIASEF